METVNIQTPQGETDYIFQGRSFMEFSKMEIDESQTLLGDRWLCRGAWGFFVAPSGLGKSVWVAQASVLWGCGKDAFGIKTPFATGMKILVIQAEDDDGDMAEMAAMINHLDLSEPQKRLVHKNTIAYQIKGLSGPDFISRALAKLVEKHKPDLVIINPLNRYLGGEEKDSKTCKEFIDALDTLMLIHNFGTLVVHHTPKTSFNSTADFKSHDWQYYGAGHANLTNAARASIVIKPIANGVFQFIAAKRGKRIGWEYHGDSICSFFKHSSDPAVMLWEPASPAEVQAAVGNQESDRGQSAKILDLDAVLQEIPETESISNEALVAALMRKFSCGDDPVKRAIAELEHKEKLFPCKIPKPNGGSGAKKKGWTRIKPSDLVESLVDQPEEVAA